MKRSIVAVVVFSVCGLVWAQPGAAASPATSSMGTVHIHNVEAKDANAAVQKHHITGTVKKIDLKAKTVTLDHEAVPTLKWPPMTMAFKVQDDATLAKIKAGAKIDADMIQRGKEYVITNAR